MDESSTAMAALPASALAPTLWQSSTLGICNLQQTQDRFYIVDINPTLAQWLCVPAEQLRGCPLAQTISTEVTQKDYYQQALSTGRSVTFKTAVHTDNNCYQWAIEVIPISQP